MKLYLDKKKALKMDFMVWWTKHTALNTKENPGETLFKARCKPQGVMCHCKQKLDVKNSPQFGDKPSIRKLITLNL